MNAAVGVVGYSDFECRYCAQFAQSTLPRVIESYVDTGRVFFAFRHFPLETIHRMSFRAAEAAECGRRQGKFWEIHDRLFAAPEEISRIDFLHFGQDLGIDASQYTACLEGQAAVVVREDAATARSLGITGTPTFLFGVLDEHGSLAVKRRADGAIPYEAFADILDQLIAEHVDQRRARVH